MTTELQSILELTPESLAAWLKEEGEPGYRLRQVLDWVYVRRVGRFEEMANLPETLRRRLEAGYLLSSLTEIERLSSKDGSTEKFLFGLSDGEQVECVAMSARGRQTFCISSQAGCPLGCRFCATGSMGFARNLTAGETLGQVVALARARNGLGNVVFMGTGEPLLNLEAVFFALESLTDRRRFGISARSITISTAGITPAIRQLSESPVRPHLALSLNSPFDEQRTALMPINRKYPLAQVLRACEHYAARTKRSVSLEYVLISGVNTSEDAVHALARTALRLRAKVNLIAFNPVAGCGFRRPTTQEVSGFRRGLQDRGVVVTQRFRRGVDIGAGCGQLRGKHMVPELER